MPVHDDLIDCPFYPNAKETIVNRMMKKELGLLLVLIVPITVWSKGETIRIEVEGDNLPSPIDITDPEIVKHFNIWNGPGVRTRGPGGVPNPPAYLSPERSAGRFIDWPEGTVAERPGGLQRYEVSFYIGGREAGTEVQGVYSVTYEFDPATEHGYVYLPTFSEQSRNTAFISHGVEGNWFRSSDKWETLVRPLIEKTMDAEGSRADW